MMDLPCKITSLPHYLKTGQTLQKQRKDGQLLVAKHKTPSRAV